MIHILSDHAATQYLALGTEGERFAVPRASIIGGVVGGASFFEADPTAARLWAECTKQDEVAVLVLWKAVCAIGLFGQTSGHSERFKETIDKLVWAECEYVEHLFGASRASALRPVIGAWAMAYAAALDQPSRGYWASTLLYWAALDSSGGQLSLEAAPIGAGSMQDFILASGSERVFDAIDLLEGASEWERPLNAKNALDAGIAAAAAELT